MAVDSVSTPSNVKVWEKKIYDVPRQKIMDSPDMGALINNRARLNTIGKLEAKDKEDIFRFKVVNEGKMSLNLATETNLRIQVLNLNGRVLADSDEKAGLAYDNFKKMSDGTYDMKRGDYAVKVTFGKDVTPKEVNYTVQMKLGDSFVHDYISWEEQASDKPVIPPPQPNPIANIFSFFIKPLRELFGG